MTRTKRMRLALGIALFLPALAFGQTITAAYDFSVSNFQDGALNSEPPPVESVSGSFGLTITPSDVSSQYDISADFVDLVILGFEYTVSNTAIQVNDGDVIALVFGGLLSGPAGFGGFTNDFTLVFFINDSGDLYLPGVIGGFNLTVDSSSDFWYAPVADVVVTRRSLGPQALLEQLTAGVSGVGPGSSLTDKLIQAGAFIEAEDLEAACEMLNAFLNQVSALSGKRLTQELAARLSSDAEAIIAAIGCN